jgi:hypothetical protein
MIRRALVGATLLLGAFSADAGLVTVDANYFAAGTDVSTATPGVTLSNFSVGAGVATFAPIYATYDPNVAATGTNVLGEGYWGEDFAKYAILDIAQGNAPSFGLSVFRADFGQATNYVDLLGSFSQGEGPRTWEDSRMDAFDQDGNLVATCSFGAAAGTSGVLPTVGQQFGCATYLGPSSNYAGVADFDLQIATTDADISTIVFGSTLGAAAAPTRLEFYDVPEPGTLALLGLGLACVGFTQWKRRAK